MQVKKLKQSGSLQIGYYKTYGIFLASKTSRTLWANGQNLIFIKVNLFLLNSGHCENLSKCFDQLGILLFQLSIERWYVCTGEP